MRNKNLLLFIVAIFPGITFAANTVEFNGAVDDTTCQIVVNGQRDTTVTLPPVPASLLNDPGSGGASEKTRFVFEINDCPISSKTRTYQITMSDPNADWSGRMHVTGTATGVTFQLYPSPGGWEELFLNTIETSVQIPPGATSGFKDYYVNYYSPLQNATPGTIRGAVQYTVAYP